MFGVRYPQFTADILDFGYRQDYLHFDKLKNFSIKGGTIHDILQLGGGFHRLMMVLKMVTRW